MDSLSEKRGALEDIGIIFVSPIIGLTPSQLSAFRELDGKGAEVAGIDIFGEYEPKTFWKVVGLTLLPGKKRRMTSFVNSFPEDKVFDKITVAIERYREEGRKRIVLGGMSGGFVFCARIVQSPPDQELTGHRILKYKHQIAGVFGVSPIVIYPPEIRRHPAKLEAISPDVPTVLFFADGDIVIPPGTVEYAFEVSHQHTHIHVKILKGEEFGKREGSIQHQFFGGKDFIWPLKNIFWDPQAERAVIGSLYAFINNLPR